MVFIGIPTYDEKLHWKTTSGLINFARYCGEKKVGLAVDVIPGDAFISKARSLIAHRFLKSNFRDLVFIDADIGFNAFDVARLCKAEAPIVCGLYRMKKNEVRYPALLFDPIVRNQQDPSLIKLQYGPTGFMRIRREVFEAMMKKWPNEYYVNVGEQKVYDFFPAGRDGINFTGEDINFCKRAQACGFDIWAMQNVEMEHVGEKSWDSNWSIDSLQIQEAA